MLTKKDTLKLIAPAKVNLFLEVVGEREDGYHDIRSVIVPVSLADNIVLEKTSASIDLHMDGSEWIGEDCLKQLSHNDNIAVRAAVLLKERTGYSGGVSIEIEKNIPIGGGLGGGSADAAAVLNGLNSLWGVDLPLNELMEIGAVLGCDVPAMICGGVVEVTGTGTAVSPMKTGDIANWRVIIVNPGICISTGDIYRRYSSCLTSGDNLYKNMRFALKDGCVEGVVKNLFNGLQGTVFGKYPQLAIIAESMAAFGVDGVLLSGSGASLFGFVRDDEHAKSVVASMERAYDAPVWSKVVSLLPDGVMVAHGPLEA